jgi:hypothetical protein
MPGPSDWRSAVDGAPGWVAANADRFRPSSGEEVFAKNHAKPVIELAIMVRCHARAGREHSGLEPLLRLLASVQDAREYRDRRVCSRNDLVVTAFLYAALRHAGQDDARQRELIERLAAARLLDHTERPPHRIMEERLALEWGSLHAPLPSWAELIELSILRTTPNPLCLDEGTTYQLTHVILYLFAFGTKRRPPSLLGHPADLRRLLTALILTSCGNRHWDLLGELLLCWTCLELEPSGVSERAWTTFLALQAADGSFPGPAKDADSEMTEDQRRFAERYHTTLVAILAGEARIDCPAPARHGRLTPTSRSREPRPVGPLLATVAKGDADWIERLLDEMLDEGEASAVCSTLVGISACSVLDALLRPRLADVASRVAARLSAVADWTDVRPALSIVTHALLADHGLVLPALAEFVGAMAAVLEASPASDAMADLALCEKRVLLHRLGHAGAPLLIEPPELIEVAAALPLDSPREAVEAFLLQVGSCSGYGTRPVSLAAGADWVGELLVGLAARFYRKYDFVTASRLLRHAAYLGVDSAHLTDHVDFLVVQRRPEGGYGFFGAHEAPVRAAGGTGLSVERDLRLPVTVSCLVALAEVTTGWRLYRNPAGVSIDSPSAAPVGSRRGRELQRVDDGGGCAGEDARAGDHRSR